MRFANLIIVTSALAGCSTPVDTPVRQPVVVATTLVAEADLLADPILPRPSVPDACGRAWREMVADQRAHWSKDTFDLACARSGYLSICKDGTIEIDDVPDTRCEMHDGRREYLKWVDA